MKKILIFLLLAFLSIEASAQFKVTAHQEGWTNIPPEAQLKGYYFQRSELVQMDNDAQLEEVMLFGHDNGHWPEFDLFKFYVAIVGYYDKSVKYISSEMVTDNYNLLIEDRDRDGKSEIYVEYIKDGSFSTDKDGYHMKAERCCDRIELK